MTVGGRHKFYSIMRALGAPSLALVCAFVLTSCGPSADVTQMESNESTLREMVANDRQQIESLEEKVKQQNDRLAELEHNNDEDQGNGDNSSDNSNPAASPAETVAPSPAAEASPSAASPAAEASPGAAATTAAASDLGGAAAANASPDEGSDENPEPGETPAAASSPGPMVAAVTPPAPSAPPSGPVANAPTWQAAVNDELAATQTDPGARLYRSGLADMHAGNFTSALAKFQDLQRRYPKSDLSEPAEFFSGNALFEMGEHEKSILQFNDLTMRYPEGRFASAALLREAEAFIKINDPIDARLTLQKLLNDHPSAPEAPTAQSMIASLSS